ncbi:MAG TPA: MBL fold metallo-hydrolase [Clostridiaceae bacterium]|nr:MBL fold metallo-hydrolase [Clostridiaceae bacterium]
MLKGIECLGHSTIKINKNNKIIYIDPYNISDSINDADYIFITHNHYDHFSEEDIKKVKNNETIIIIIEDLYTNTLKLGFNGMNIITVKPNENYQVEGIKFSTIPAYNTNKTFHPKENNWVGYIIELEGSKYYIAGDTDITEENKKVKCDVAFVPVGGTYTMDFKEAAHLINEIKPKIAVPIHYGSIVGTIQDATDFVKLLHPNIKGIILIK